MSKEAENSPKRTSVRPRRRITKEYVEQCKALQEKILVSRGGEPLPSSVEEIRQMREGLIR